MPFYAPHMSKPALDAEAIYDEHIAALSHTTKLRLLSLIATKLETAAARTSARLQDLSGLGREVWEGNSADAYVRELRDEWQARE